MRNRFIITQTNKNRNITYKLTNRFEVYNNTSINYITKQKTFFETKLIFNLKHLKIKLRKRIFIESICVRNIVLIIQIFFARTS